MNMEVVHAVQDIRGALSAARKQHKRVALVPTMGALHSGHLALVKEAARRGDVVVVSIFVNPTQFGPGEDFDRYPRSLEQDVSQLRSVGAVQYVFAPPVEEIYPGAVGRNEPIRLVVTGLDRELCGRHRDGHFNGVVTVVAKLLNIVRPDVAVFGLKDAQQFVILKRLVQDFHYDIEMVGVPTIREENGLAMSSRNAYLTSKEREQAVVLSRAIAEAVRRIRSGEQHIEGVVGAMLETMATSTEARVQYAQVVDAHTLQPVDDIAPSQQLLVAVAAYFGQTRLIDSGFVAAPTRQRSAVSGSSQREVSE